MHGADKQKIYAICFGNGYSVQIIQPCSGPICDFVFMEDEKSVFWINTHAVFVIHHLTSKLNLIKQDTHHRNCVLFPNSKPKKSQMKQRERERSIEVPVECFFQS